jgi:hypothetical protein
MNRDCRSLSAEAAKGRDFIKKSGDFVTCLQKSERKRAALNPLISLGNRRKQQDLRRVGGFHEQEGKKMYTVRLPERIAEWQTFSRCGRWKRWEESIQRSLVRENRSARHS